jgi:hypothetical protein
MSFCGGLAAFGSGFVKQAWGFHLLADVATVVAVALLLTAWVRWRLSGRAVSSTVR